MDYFIRDCFTTKLIDSNTALKYLNALTIFNNEIVIKNQELAKEMAENFMKMNLTFWGSICLIGTVNVFADALRIALKNKIISEDDFFTTDIELLNKLKSSNNKIILKNIEMVKHISNFQKGTLEDYDLKETTKARFIDPKFLSNGKIIRLSEIGKEFKNRIEDFKKIYEKGFYIKIRR